MNKTDIMEIKKRLKKTETNISKFYSFYVNGDGEVSFYRKDNLLSLRDDNEADFHKFLEIHKKLFSGKAYDLDFTGSDSKEVKMILDALKDELKDEEVIKTLVSKISESFLKDMYTRALITISIDSYDVPEKTSDKIKTGESDEVYSFIMCSICPVTLSKAGLSVYEDSKEIKARELDSIVAPTELGFVYPSFTDRSSDDSTITLFSKNKTKTWDNFVSEFLKCDPIVIEPEISEQKNVEEQFIEENNTEATASQDISIKSEVSYNEPVSSGEVYTEENLCVKEDLDEDLSADNGESFVSTDNTFEDISNTSETKFIADNNSEFSEEDIETNNEDNDSVAINTEDVSTEDKEDDSKLSEENLNKFLEKINKLLDDNKEASYQIIDGKKYLLIPVD